jgi:hypothetical protein
MGKAITWASRVNRKALTVISLQASENDVVFWRSQTPEARLRFMELLRRINYGHAATTARLKRILEVVQLEKG